MGILGFVKGLFTGFSVEPDLVKPIRTSSSHNVSAQLHRPTMSAPTTSGSRKPRKRNAKGQFVSEA
jgi:hypothetical protein